MNADGRMRVKMERVEALGTGAVEWSEARVKDENCNEISMGTSHFSTYPCLEGRSPAKKEKEEVPLLMQFNFSTS